jgi:hypothetical protein
MPVHGVGTFAHGRVFFPVHSALLLHRPRCGTACSMQHAARSEHGTRTRILTSPPSVLRCRDPAVRLGDPGGAHSAAPPDLQVSLPRGVDRLERALCPTGPDSLVSKQGSPAVCQGPGLPPAPPVGPGCRPRRGRPAQHLQLRAVLGELPQGAPYPCRVHCLHRGARSRLLGSSRRAAVETVALAAFERCCCKSLIMLQRFATCVEWQASVQAQPGTEYHHNTRWRTLECVALSPGCMQCCCWYAVHCDAAVPPLAIPRGRTPDPVAAAWEQGAAEAAEFSTPAVLESVQLSASAPLADVHPALKTLPKPFQLQARRGSCQCDACMSIAVVAEIRMQLRICVVLLPASKDEHACVGFAATGPQVLSPGMLGKPALPMLQGLAAHRPHLPPAHPLALFVSQFGRNNGNSEGCMRLNRCLSLNAALSLSQQQSQRQLRRRQRRRQRQQHHHSTQDYCSATGEACGTTLTQQHCMAGRPQLNNQITASSTGAAVDAEPRAAGRCERPGGGPAAGPSLGAACCPLWRHLLHGTLLPLEHLHHLRPRPRPHHLRRLPLRRGTPPSLLRACAPSTAGALLRRQLQSSCSRTSS